MAQFKVTLSQLESASSKMKGLVESFNEEANAIRQAVATLAGGWTGDASDTFQENMNAMNAWMNQMSEILQTYPQALTQNEQTYAEADAQSAAAFK